VKKLLLVCSLLFVVAANAAPIETKIHQILSPEKGEQNYLVLATDGLVYEIDKNDTEIVDMAFMAMEDKSVVTIELNTLSGIRKLMNQSVGIKSLELMSNELPEFAPMDVEFAPNADPLDSFKVSVLADMNVAKRYFSTMKTRTRRRSQCYNRAHIWSYELSTDHGLKTGKMWLFFSARYIKEYKYKWWFHIAPYIEVATVGEPVVLDREFSRTPQPLTAWKNVYMKNNANCAKTNNYTMYENNTWNEYCFLIKSSMYYWQPFNLEKLAKEGESKFGFDKSELERAYSNGFSRRDRRDLD